MEHVKRVLISHGGFFILHMNGFYVFMHSSMGRKIMSFEGLVRHGKYVIM